MGSAGASVVGGEAGLESLQLVGDGIGAGPTAGGATANGDARLPIVVGLIQPTAGAALLGALLAPAPAAAAAPVALATPPVEARVDGKRVVIEGKDEVTLKCGDALITLRRDGKVILRGAYIETTASGVNRIRGGSVKIN